MKTPRQIIAETEVGFADLRLGDQAALNVIWQLEVAGFKIVQDAEIERLRADNERLRTEIKLVSK